MLEEEGFLFLATLFGIDFKCAVVEDIAVLVNLEEGCALVTVHAGGAWLVGAWGHDPYCAL